MHATETCMAKGNPLENKGAVCSPFYISTAPKCGRPGFDRSSLHVAGEGCRSIKDVRSLLADSRRKGGRSWCLGCQRAASRVLQLRRRALGRACLAHARRLKRALAAGVCGSREFPRGTRWKNHTRLMQRRAKMYSSSYSADLTGADVPVFRHRAWHGRGTWIPSPVPSCGG